MEDPVGGGGGGDSGIVEGGNKSKILRKGMSADDVEVLRVFPVHLASYVITDYHYV